MSSLDPIISADLVRTRAELAAVSTALASARNEIAGVAAVMNATRSELAAARNEIAGVGASSNVKSIQRGVIELVPSAYTTTVINVGWVDLNKCTLRTLGYVGVMGSSDNRFSNSVMVKMLNNSQIQAEVTYAGASNVNTRVSWELVEYK